MEVITVHVTAADIASATPTELDNPLARAFGRATGSSWRIYYGAVAVETVPPRRAGVLPLPARAALQQYMATGWMPPLQFVIEVRTSGPP